MRLPLTREVSSSLCSFGSGARATNNGQFTTIYGRTTPFSAVRPTKNTIRRFVRLYHAISCYLFMVSFSVIHSRAMQGLDAVPIKVEAHIGQGLPRIDIVGLPEKAVCESRQRVRAAIRHSGFEFPQRPVIVNLAPADLRKQGSRYDLPIALGILAATQQIPARKLNDYEFISELGLDGGLRPVSGALNAALATRQTGRALVIPEGNACEVGLVSDATAYTGKDLLSVCCHLAGTNGADTALTRVAPVSVKPDDSISLNFSDIRGQHSAARALEVAAAGGHNCLMLGSPGGGKTMLAQRFPDILPAMSEHEALSVAAVRSLCREPIVPERMYRRVVRAPHHTASPASLAGGGSDLRPGEITRAHHGVLFLDELPEFGRRTLEALREPLETGYINIARAAGKVSYPADFQLIATMNPCPDGSDVDENGRCPCNDGRLRQYYARLSPPLLDRIDIYVRVPKLKWASDAEMPPPCDTTEHIRQRTAEARRRQIERQGICNARLPDNQVQTICALSKENRRLLFAAMAKLDLSMRAMSRILKVARSVADLAAAEHIEKKHLLEAISYRSLTHLFKT